MDFKTVLINLNRRPDRLAEVTKQCDNFGVKFERIEAVDDRFIGCNKSHYKAITHKHKGNLLVLEDDVEFTTDARAIFDKAITQLPDNFDVLYLGANLRAPLKRYSDNLHKLKDCWCTQAVLYSQKACDYIAANFNPETDQIFDEWMRIKGLNELNSFLVTPMIAFQSQSYSDLQLSDKSYTALMKESEAKYTERIITNDYTGLRVLAVLHGYPPTHNAGAEHYAHAMFKYLVSKGIKVRVLTKNVGAAFLDGVELFEQNPETEYQLAKWSDIIIGALNTSGRTINLSKEHHKKLFNILHNTFNNRPIENRSADVTLIANADHCLQDCREKKYEHEIHVVRPVIWVNDYKTETTREYITLINLNENKGGLLFRKLYDRMPNDKFMGVVGGYGEQIMDNPAPQNVTFINNTPNITKDVYSKTKILLMPSQYESYGRTAVEAMCSGIPVIYAETPGLIESVGDAGIRMPQEATTQDWINVINKLNTDEKMYQKYVKAGMERAAMLEEKAQKELDLLIQNLNKYA